MPKSALEKQIEKQMKQAKQLADKQYREKQKRAREEDRMARRETIRQQASSIVNGQPFVAGFRIMDATAEEVLKCLLDCERAHDNHVNYENDIFSDYIKSSLSLEMEKLIQYGMIGGLNAWMGGGTLSLLPPACSYYADKDKALERQERNAEEVRMQNIVNYGNLVFGNVSDSTLSVDNSIREIERTIDEKGGEDKEDLRDILDEVKELMNNLETSRSIPKQKKLFQRLTSHLSAHGWFYGAVIQLLGTQILTLLG